MSNATRQLARLNGSDPTVAFAAVNDAVWAVTIVDAAMVRYHLGVYDRMLDGVGAADRRLVEESLAGLRFLRNRVQDDAAVSQFVEAGSGRAAGQTGVTGWTWKWVPAPVVMGPPAGAEPWEMSRYRGYQARLVGHSVGEVFDRAEAFLYRTAEEARVITDIGV